MNTTKLYHKRIKRLTKDIRYDGGPCLMTVKICFDDDCKNGHNTFAITGSIYTLPSKIYSGGGHVISGCIHDEIAKYFPELALLIKWHLCNDDGPMYYIENTLYHLGYRSGPDEAHYMKPHEPNIEHARSTAVWPDMPESLICGRAQRMLKSTRDAALPVKALLEARLPALMIEFNAAMATIAWDVVEERL